MFISARSTCVAARIAAIAAMVAVAAPPALGFALGDGVCGSLNFHYGPFDFRTQQGKLPIVEGAHFTSSVESLRRGRTAVEIGGDLSYTLRAFPNHPRALDTVRRYVLQTRSPTPRDLPWPAECYFERAIRFASDDATVRLLYSQFLIDQKRPAEAIRQLRWVLDQGERNPVTLQFVGLYFAELADWEAARETARRAVATGIPPPLLLERLRSAGQWSEADAAAASAAASAPATPATPAAAAPPASAPQ